MVETQSRSERSIAPAAAHAGVVVDIYDQIYQLRGVDPAHIAHLAAVVDGKMRAVSAHGATVDSLRVAVLAALNLADELVTLRARYEALCASLEAGRQTAAESAVRSRAGSLMGMLDEVLEERRAG
ncbi:MAG: cell division protein ZapA [Acidobacteriota bacterium]